MVERAPICVQIPVRLVDLLSQASKKVEGKRKICQWQIVARALDFYFTTNLEWNQSEKAALYLKVIQKLGNGTINPVTLNLSVASALKLRNELNQKLDALGINLEDST